MYEHVAKSVIIQSIPCVDVWKIAIIPSIPHIAASNIAIIPSIPRIESTVGDFGQYYEADYGECEDDSFHWFVFVCQK